MVDIFKDIKPQPKLYIADVCVIIRSNVRKNSKKFTERSIRMDREPIVLAEGEIPTEKSKVEFFKRVFRERINIGDFDKAEMTIDKIDNCVFSSNLAYEFDYNRH